MWITELQIDRTGEPEVNAIIALYLTAQIAVQDQLASDEGQTTMEWLGIGVVVIAVLLAVASQNEALGDVVAGAFEDLVGRVMGG